MIMEKEVTYNQHTFKISKLDKIFFPENKISKGDVIDYYERISGIMLPYLENRPLTMLRYPNGIEDKKFFQKDEPDYFPDWITTEKIKKKEKGSTQYVVCNNKETLVYLANQACITPHVWLSTVQKLTQPNRFIFDLDPADNNFKKVKSAAQKIRELLEEEFNFPVYVMTTGSRGLHLMVPLQPEKDFDEVRSFTQQLAKHLEQKFPEEMTTAVRKEKREGKLFLDVARNAFAQTAVAPYALRALPKAPVATPLDWEELSGLNSAQKYTLKNIFKRLGSKEDPWKNSQQHAIKLGNAQKQLQQLTD